MVEDAVGEAIGGAVEVAADVLADIGADGLAYDARRRRRCGCWRLFLIVLLLAAAITLGVIVLGS